MSDLDALLAGIVADPHNWLRWLVMADWLEDHGFPERAELVRVHRELLRTSSAAAAYPERGQLHSRVMELMRLGARPCVPQRSQTLPDGAELSMSFIPPGSFLGGSPESEDGRRVDEEHRAFAIPHGFWLGVSPVTQRQWEAIAGANPSHFRGDELPVERVTWDEAVDFCEVLSGSTGVPVRLPTSVEWEYACRAGTTTPFYWGSELNGTEANCDGTVPYGTDTEGPNLGRTSPVGQYEAVSPHPWGLVDMIGNVLEWCGDPAIGDSRVRRGGSWLTPATHCRSAFRYWSESNSRLIHLGFRIAADATAS